MAANFAGGTRASYRKRLPATRRIARSCYRRSWRKRESSTCFAHGRARGPHREIRGRACARANRVIRLNEVESNSAPVPCVETFGVRIVQTTTTRLGGQEDAS